MPPIPAGLDPASLPPVLMPDRSGPLPAGPVVNAAGPGGRPDPHDVPYRHHLTRAFPDGSTVVVVLDPGVAIGFASEYTIEDVHLAG